MMIKEDSQKDSSRIVPIAAPAIATVATTPTTGDTVQDANTTSETATDGSSSKILADSNIHGTVINGSPTGIVGGVAAVSKGDGGTEDVPMPRASEDAVALAAMQEAAAIVMEAQQKNSGSKRKTEDLPTRPPPPKKRSTPTRVSWEERLKQLAEYKAGHGNLLIPIRYKLNPSLGKFVHNTREQYKLYHRQTPQGYKKKCSLTAERIRQLEDLGFAWTTERAKNQQEDWQNRFQQLQGYHKEHGHCLVPHGYVRDPSFAEWIHRQRTTYANMNKDQARNKPINPTVAYRMQQLEDLGFNFTVHSDKWMDHWNQLKVYKEKSGDCQVPTHYAENPKLGRWVHTQRHQRRLQSKGKKSCMTTERIALLDQLGFSWEVRPSLERPRATWQQRLEELTEFKSNQGHFEMGPSSWPQLHAWCHEQRQRLRLLEKNNGKDVTKRMSSERVQALKEIGFSKDAKLVEAKTSATNQDDDKEGVDGNKGSSNKGLPKDEDQIESVDSVGKASSEKEPSEFQGKKGDNTDEQSGGKEPESSDKVQGETVAREVDIVCV